MEPAKYTKPSSESSAIHDRSSEQADLVFPDWSGNLPSNPVVPLDVLVLRIPQVRRMFAHENRPAEERWQDKTTQEFFL